MHVQTTAPALPTTTQGQFLSFDTEQILYNRPHVIRLQFYAPLCALFNLARQQTPINANDRNQLIEFMKGQGAYLQDSIDETGRLHAAETRFFRNEDGNEAIFYRCHYQNGQRQNPLAEIPAYEETDPASGYCTRVWYEAGLQQDPKPGIPALTYMNPAGRVVFAEHRLRGLLHNPCPDYPAMLRFDDKGKLIEAQFYENGHRTRIGTAEDLARPLAMHPLESVALPPALQEHMLDGRFLPVAPPPTPRP